MREPFAGTIHEPVRSVRSEFWGTGTSFRKPTDRILPPATTIMESPIGCAPGETIVVAPISTFSLAFVLSDL